MWRPLYHLVPSSSSLKHLWVFMKLLLGELDYNVWKQFDKLGCDRIYEVTKIFDSISRKYLVFGIFDGNILSMTNNDRIASSIINLALTYLPPHRTRVCALGATTASRVWAPRW